MYKEKDKVVPSLIVANWKMNGLLAQSMQMFKTLRAYVMQDLLACEVVICPPATLLRDFAEKLPGTRLKLGGQNCATTKKGAYTGEISAEMLCDMTCEYVILGHSERRIYFHETDDDVRTKAQQAIEAGLKPIICIGENESEYNAGKAEEVVRRQLIGSVPRNANANNIIIAYEPVWAIGTDATPTPAEVTKIHNFIADVAKDELNFGNDVPRIIYGGSTNEDNAKDFLSAKNVNGLLVGRASLDAEAFWKIIQSVNLYRV